MEFHHQALRIASIEQADSWLGCLTTRGAIKISLKRGGEERGTQRSSIEGVKQICGIKYARARAHVCSARLSFRDERPGACRRYASISREQQISSSRVRGARGRVRRKEPLQRVIVRRGARQGLRAMWATYSGSARRLRHVVVRDRLRLLARALGRSRRSAASSAIGAASESSRELIGWKSSAREQGAIG